MPAFNYEAMNSVGQPVKGRIDASSSEDAISKVRALGHFPTKIKETGKKRVSKASAAQPSGGGGGGGGGGRRTVGAISVKLLTQFTRQLSTLVDAGLPILRSLRILEQQQKPGMLRVAIRLVAEEVEGGATMSEALSHYPKAFDHLYVNMVRAGELGGVLDIILQRLADFMEKAQALKRKVIGAMIYPVAVIFFAMVIVTGLLVVVVPKFKGIFDGMGQKLPGATQMLLGFSDTVVNGGWMAIIGTPIGIWLIFKLMSTSEGGRYMVDKIKISVPIMGKIVQKSAVARFTRTLGTLLSAGVPILEAINITRETSGNAVFSQALAKVRDGIREGDSFADPLRQAKIVEPMVVNMIDVGEETGELDKMLEKVADTYDDEVDALVSGMTAMLEPIMVVFLGGIVGFIVVALFMPMVGMIQGMQ